MDNVDVAVSGGEIVGLLGPNGAGKTTCFYMICGLIRRDNGHIVLDGNDISDLPMHERARRGIGYLPQEASIFKRLTVKENILAVLEALPGLDPKWPAGPSHGNDGDFRHCSQIERLWL